MPREQLHGFPAFVLDSDAIGPQVAAFSRFRLVVQETRFDRDANIARDPLVFMAGQFCCSTVTFVLTELAMKQPSWAAWCIFSSSSRATVTPDDQVILGRNATRVIASRPASFFSSQPTASSTYESS